MTGGDGRAPAPAHGGLLGVRMVVNGGAVERAVSPRRSLAEFLREDLGLTGTHVGCEHGVCGACSVLVDGRSARSCLLFAVQLEGARVTTIEGLAPVGLAPGEHGPGGLASGEPPPGAPPESGRVARVLQEAFRDCHALQCGFCTPGMIVAAHELLGENPAPSQEQIRAALAGNLCMCTGYVNIVRAVERAAARLRREPSRAPAAPGP